MTSQLSYSGTPRSRANLTQPDEYVRDLQDPVKRMEIFDEMRSSDEAINTAISAREQMIGSSNWLLSSTDDTPLGKEILEFCEDNIYPVLPELLRHLAGAIQYGFGACEKVFEYADRPFARNIVRGKIRRATKSIGRRIYLRKLAHIASGRSTASSSRRPVISNSSASTCTRALARSPSSRPTFRPRRFCSGRSTGAATTTGVIRRPGTATAPGSSNSSSRS
jgi:hypothetical protein